MLLLQSIYIFSDIVFLLLIFFMVTSTLINPNALKLLLPKSTHQTSNRPTPDTKLPSPLLSPGAHTPALLLQMLAMAAVLLALGVGGWVYGRRLLARRRAAREALEAGEGDDTGKQGEA